MKNIKNANNLKTLNFKTILFIKYINKTMLIITNSQKLMKIVKKFWNVCIKFWFSKELMIKSTLLQQSETMYNCLYFYTESLDWKILHNFIKVLQVERPLTTLTLNLWNLFNLHTVFPLISTGPQISAAL